MRTGWRWPATSWATRIGGPSPPRCGTRPDSPAGATSRLTGSGSGPAASGAPRQDEEGAAAAGAALHAEAGDGRPDGGASARHADPVSELGGLHEAERPCPAFVD